MFVYNKHSPTFNRLHYSALKSIKLHNIIRIVVCTILGAYTFLLAILNFGPTERKLTQFVSHELSQKLHTEVSIGNIQVGLFNRLILNNVLIKDLQQKKLLQAGCISAKIELRSLLKDQLSLRTVSLLDTHITLYKSQADSAANYQFLIDAFTSKDNKKESNLNLRINSIILRRVNASYDELYKPETPLALNFSHLKVKALNANISLKSITPDSVSLRVRSLAFTEKSGVCLKNLHLKLNANRTSAHIEDFSLDMQQTHITQCDLLATYDVRKSFSNLFRTLRMGATFDHIQVNTNDIRPFVKLPKDLNQTLQLSTTLFFTPERIQFSQLNIHNTDQSVLLNANVTLNRADNRIKAVSLTFNKLHIGNQFTRLITHVFPIKTATANIIHQIGNVNANGSMLYNFESRKAFASVIAHTAIGSIATNANVNDKKINATLQINHAQPDVLLNNTKLPTQVALNARILADFSNSNSPKINSTGNILSATYNNYTFHGIQYRIAFQPTLIKANIQSKDPAAQLTADTQISLHNKNIAFIDLSTDIKQLHPQLFNIQTPFKQAIFSGSIKAKLQQAKTGIPHGSININNLLISNAPRGNYQLNKLSASLTDIGNCQQKLQILSDFLDAKLEGQITPQQIGDGIRSILNKCLPGLMSAPHHLAKDDAKWDIDFHLKKTDILHALFGINVDIKNPLHAMGTINSGNGPTSLSIFTDSINFNNQAFVRPSIYLKGIGDQYTCLVQSHKKISGRDYGIVAHLSTHDGQLKTQIEWEGKNEKNYNGSFESTTTFSPTPKGINFNMDIRPTHFALADTIWNIASGKLSYINRHLAFSGVELSHANQSLRIDGQIAPNKNDSIVAQLRNIDVDYILGLVNFDAVAFGGKASGQAIFTQQGNTPQLHANLHIPDFSFNYGPMGAADIKANWNKNENRINLDADMRLPGNKGYGTKLQGYVSLAEKGLNLNIGVNHTRLDFLRRYIDGIFENFNGDATGQICLYGPFKKLDFNGQVTANCSAKVLSTGVDYKLTNGEVSFAPGEFAFHNFTLSDGRGGQGTANGVLRHTHLKKLNYTFDITANKLLCYNQPKQPDLAFYSTTIGSGNVHLNGWPNHFRADITLTPSSQTLFVYDLGTQTSLSKDDRMIRFHALKDNTFNSYDTLRISKEFVANNNAVNEEEPGTDMLLNFNINMTPQAQIRIITDDRSGDAITAYGNGPLRASWHNKGGFNMYGVYTLTRGDYNISLQDIIRKDLVLQPGSNITFTGDPLNADLALKALYTVNGVALNDLNYGAGFSNKMVRADCILNIGGKARAPQVNFDLDLHNISEDEKQMVRQLISTDDDMSRQVMFLLGVGRFMPTAQSVTTASATTSQQQSSAAVRSFLSTTLTGQLNAAISSILGNQSKWTFGTNFMPGTEGWNNVEVDGLLQGRLLNDRLLINGNFGYRDNPYYASNFIGDFDIRYLLTPRGSVSLRAYSETNDRYFTKSSLTTQGVGIVLQREFVKLWQLFRKNNKTKRTK